MFPRDPELALYALATLQSFVDHYYRSIERVQIMAQHPETARELQVELHCEQKFYLQFRASFPACVQYMLVGDALRRDDMCIVLHESRLEMFDLPPGYSVQWAMAQIAGTMPQMLPTLVMSEPMDGAMGVLLQEGLRCRVPETLHDPATLFGRVPRHVRDLPIDAAYNIAVHARMVVAEQSFLTTLATALGKPVVEITRTASNRTLLGRKNYVQVSYLAPQSYFQATLERGIQWLSKKTTSMSAVSNAPASSPDSPAPLASHTPPASFANAPLTGSPCPL